MQLLEWNAEQVAKLTELWADNLTASQVAELIGTTRNAVIGKVHRLKLPARKPRCVDPAVLEKRVKRIRVRHLENQRRRRGSIKKERPMLTEPVADPPKFCGSLDLLFSELRHLTNAAQNQCRWIEGDSLPRIACGNETEPGRAYCGYHHGIVYTKRVVVSDDEIARRAAHGRALGLANVRKGNVRGYHVPQSVRGPSEVSHG